MERKKCEIVLFLTLIYFIHGYLFTANSAPQTFPMESTLSPRFWLDLGVFHREDNKAQVEVYYSVILKELAFNKAPEGNLASFTFTVSIKDSADQIVYEDLRQRKTRASSQTEIDDESKGIIDQFVFDLIPGLYKLECQLMDNLSQAASQLEGTFRVPTVTSHLSVSDPQFATIITKDLSNKLFVKGSRTIYPKPSCIYTHKKSLLYFYYEVYNLVVNDESIPLQFQVSYAITDLKGDSLITVPDQTVKKPGTSCIKMQAVDIRGLEPGLYRLIIDVHDPTSDQTASTNKTFWVQESKQDQETIPMTKEDMKKYRDQIQYLASNEELKIFDSLTPEGKSSFLVNFWRSKDTDPSTPENEFMLDYFSRIEYSNKHFKGVNGGLNTDMGRVFIVYGQPDDIEDHNWETGIAPFVIWRYFAQGWNHSFVFIDRNHEGIYTLVHSTVVGEVKNEEWADLEAL